MKFVAIVPTYNEAGNIEKLIRAVETETIGLTGDVFEILIIDGRSPDGTGLIVRKLQGEFTNLHLLEKEKGGLGADYAFAMKHAIAEMGADVIIEMDADLQHDPADLPRLAVQIDSGYDYILGSRFTKGGSIPRDWEFYRKFLSIVGNLASRLILNLPKITDYTTGFKASRVKGFLEKIDLDHLASRGFAYKIHLLSAMVDLGAKVKEIPINFKNREEGVSKMEGNNPLESLGVVLKIRLTKSQRFLKFLAVGFLGLLLNFGGYKLFIDLFKWHPALANFVGAEAAVISNFYFNNRWTFADRRHDDVKVYLTKFFHFNLTSAFGVVVIQSGIIWLLTAFWGRSFYVFNFLVATSFLVVYNFVIYSRVIWRRKK